MICPDCGQPLPSHCEQCQRCLEGHCEDCGACLDVGVCPEGCYDDPEA